GLAPVEKRFGNQQRVSTLSPFAAFTAACGGGECGEGDGMWLRYAALVFKLFVHWGKPEWYEVKR
ncbi:MAG: hypothetical protein NTY19_36335, partial [Planctomycetota bacterium]|nr:hypothetical protein [Planctomycetota bacterium]